MLTPEEMNAIFDRTLAGQATEADVAKLRGELQRGKFNIQIGSAAAGDFHIGDRIYNGIDAETLRLILRKIRDSQANVETIKQAVQEVLQSLKPPLPSLEEQEKAVRQFLGSVYERFSSVEFLHRRGEKVALRDQYIPIQVTLDKQPEKSSAGRYLGYVESEAELQQAYALKKEDDQREQIDWQEARKKHQRIMVLADPGMGKTTLLRMEAGTLAEQEQQALDNGSKTLETVLLPVWLRLSNLAELVQQATDTALEAILKLVKAEWNAQQFARLQPALEAKLENGQCLLLLDALDEVPRQLRDRLSERLEVFAREYPCSIICTSRIVGYTTLLKGATQVEIVPFRQEQTEIYIEKWFTNAADTLTKTGDETVSAKNLIQELKSKPQIQGLGTNPLMLSLICSLYQKEGITLPARRCQVYKKAVEYMLGEWQEDNQRKTQEPGWIDAKAELLEVLAYQFTCENKELFELRELRKKIDQYKKSDAASSDFEGINATDLITELTEQDGILQKLSEKDYLFFHRTFQEYFTASYLVSAGKEGIALAKAHLWNFEWHETISLMTGLMEDPLDLIQEILHEKDDIFQTQLLLAGRCVAEFESNSHKLIVQIIDKIYQFWLAYPDADFIRSVMVAIGRVNSQVLQQLQTALKDENIELRRIAVDVLVEIGNAEVIAPLSQALYDQDINVRYSAVEELVKIGSSEVIALFKQVLQHQHSDVRCSAVDGLSQIKDPEVITLLNESLYDQDSGVRNKAIDGLVDRIDSPETTVFLSKAIHHQDSDIRHRAAIELAKIGNPEEIAFPGKSIQHQARNFIHIHIPAYIPDSNTSVKTSELSELADFLGGRAESVSTASSGVIDLLSKNLHYQDGNLLGMFVFFKGGGQNLSSSPCPEMIIPFSQDELTHPRLAEIIAFLSRQLHHEDRDIRYISTSILARMCIPEVIIPLSRVIHDRDIDVRREAISGLAKISSLEVLENLVKLPEVNVYRSELFLFARKLAIQFIKSGAPFIPVYPELVVNLVKRS